MNDWLKSEPAVVIIEQSRLSYEPLFAFRDFILDVQVLSMP